MSNARRILTLALSFLLALGLAGPSLASDAVETVADQRLAIGAAELPVYVSEDWTVAHPGVTRAIVVFHGLTRDAADSFRAVVAVRGAAGEAGRSTLVVAPQFLTRADVEAHQLAVATLFWSRTGWESGAPALGPAAISSFDAVDAILLRLADRKAFPDLEEIVLAGHSGGAQLTQRYALIGHGEAKLSAAGIALRYVVADPSSYAWLGADRPRPDIARTCPGFDRWKYGLQDLPPYAQDSDLEALAAAYSTRRVIYLLGTRDADPNHPELDKSCMAEAQGPQRLARGKAFFAALKARFGAKLNQQLSEAPGIAHSAERMFASPCGLAALFDAPGCPP